jgi:hypothetical protein
MAPKKKVSPDSAAPAAKKPKASAAPAAAFEPTPVFADAELTARVRNAYE